MAYNLQPLITILQQILNPDQQSCWILDHNKPQLQSLLEKAASLQQILEKTLHPKIEGLESQIREAAHKAEDMIESRMVDQILSSPQGVSFIFSTPDLQQVIQQLDSVMEQVVKLAEEKRMSGGSSSSGASLSHDLINSKSILVGVDEDLMRLKDRLLGMRRKLEIVPILGMGGIGVLRILCALPNLEVLKIRNCAFKSKDTNEECEEADEEWEAVEGDEFSSLQFLLLEQLNLVRWRADETNFPILRHLMIRNCWELEEIPGRIGEIPTLQLIELEDCNDSTMASAKQILEEQQSDYENYDLQLRIS